MKDQKIRSRISYPRDGGKRNGADDENAEFFHEGDPSGGSAIPVAGRIRRDGVGANALDTEACAVAEQLAAVPDLDRRLGDLEKALDAAADQKSPTATTARYILEVTKEAKENPKAFDGRPLTASPKPKPGKFAISAISLTVTPAPDFCACNLRLCWSI